MRRGIEINMTRGHTVIAAPLKYSSPLLSPFSFRACLPPFSGIFVADILLLRYHLYLKRSRHQKYTYSGETADIEGSLDHSHFTAATYR